MFPPVVGRPQIALGDEAPQVLQVRQRLRPELVISVCVAAACDGICVSAAISATRAGTVARRIIGPAAVQDAYETSFAMLRRTAGRGEAWSCGDRVQLCGNAQIMRACR
jgi:hypothetical protein